MRMGRPDSMLLRAAIPMRQDMAPSRVPASWPKGSGALGLRKILSCSRASPPPWPLWPEVTPMVSYFLFQSLWRMSGSVLVFSPTSSLISAWCRAAWLSSSDSMKGMSVKASSRPLVPLKATFQPS